MFSESADKAMGLTRFLNGSLPTSRISFVLIVFISFVIGAMTGAVKDWPAFPTMDQLSEDTIRAVFLIAIPALLGGAACISARRGVKYKQILFLSMLSTVVYGVFYFIHFSGIISSLNAPFMDSFNLLLLSNALIFILWFVVAKIVFNLKYTPYLFGLVTPTLNVMFLVMNKSVETTAPSMVLAKLYFASFIFLIAVYAIFWLINAPMKRNFGVPLTDAASLFLAQWFRESDKLEEMFEEVGERITTQVGIMAFKSGGKLKAVFVIPHIHYGPFGSLGGSEFPYMIEKEIKERTGAIGLVFHGCATHDFNPVSRSEVEKFYARIFGFLEAAKYKAAKGMLRFGASGVERVKGVDVNGVLFAPITRAPRTTEDNDFSVGLSLRNYALACGAKEALILDAHNAETGKIMRVTSGSPIQFSYMEAIKNAYSKSEKPVALELGIAVDSLADYGLDVGVGKAGMKAIVFKLGKKKYAILLIDANGITPRYRLDLRKRIKALGIRAVEICTTDAHSVNKVGGVLNPIGGERMDTEAFGKRVEKLVKKAMADAETVEMSASLENVEQVKIFGVTQSSELIGTINSVVAIVRIAAPVALVGAVAVALWVLARI